MLKPLLCKEKIILHRINQQLSLRQQLFKELLFTAYIKKHLPFFYFE